MFKIALNYHYQLIWLNDIGILRMVISSSYYYSKDFYFSSSLMSSFYFFAFHFLLNASSNVLKSGYVHNFFSLLLIPFSNSYFSFLTLSVMLLSVLAVTFLLWLSSEILLGYKFSFRFKAFSKYKIVWSFMWLTEDDLKTGLVDLVSFYIMEI